MSKQNLKTNNITLTDLVGNDGKLLKLNATGDVVNSTIGDEILVAVDTLTIKAKQLTGFFEPENIIVTYDGTTRKVTLTGTVEAYWRGDAIVDLFDGWESTAHADEVGNWFLYYNGTSFVWQKTTSWTFDMLQIAMIYRDGVNVCIRECHGLMDVFTHEQLHYAIGTSLRSGGEMSNITTNSTTVANRRPYIAETVVVDEDLKSTITALSTNAYTQFKINSSTAELTNDNADIIPLNGNQPYYNQFNGSTWVQTLMSNNNYAKIFVMAIPTSDGTNCLKNRFIFIQPQTQSATLATIQALTPANVNLSQLGNSVSEFVFIGEIIIRYTASNWVVTSYTKLTGTKANQTATQTINDANYVHTTGDESIAGIKTFTDTTEATTTVDGGTRVSGGLSVAKTVVADNIVAENFKPNVSRGKLRIASSFQSIAVDIRNTGSTTIFTPAAGEEYIIATNLLEIVSWSGTCTSTPSINFYAGGTNQVLNTVSLSTNYDVTTAGAVQLAGSAAPAARRRITNSAPLIINVGTAATGGTITAASVAFVGMLIRVK
jgi:hypothetical protein